MTSFFLMVFTTDEDSLDDGIGDDACDNCVEFKVVVKIVVGEAVVVAVSDGYPHITLKLPFNPPENTGREIIYDKKTKTRVSLILQDNLGMDVA